MKKYPLLNYMGSYAQELLYETSNSALFGIPEALKNATQKIYTQAKLNNEALYYFQVRTFLETLDLDEDEISKFMQENPNHQRLGLEIFKILESTFLEKQAIMLAKTFKLYASAHLSKQDFDKFTYIISKLNQHLFSQIIQLNDLYNENIDFEGGASVPFLNMDFISFGFVERRFEPSFGDSDLLLNFKNHEYLVQNEFIEFYEKIFKD